MERIAIWETSIPYNQPEIRKTDLMRIRTLPKPFALLYWAKSVFGSKAAKSTEGLDSYTWLEEIRSGNTSEFLDDVPYLVPFLCKGSDTAVIIAPGGGFATQSREDEGYAIARALNENGITAFVLEYRMNPYQAPVCYLDMQRAIRHVRFHCAAYGLKSDQIGAMGFSAGGYVAGASAILLGNAPVTEPGYLPDETDLVSALPDFLGLIYPVTNFDQNPNMLSMLDREGFFDEKRRVGLQQQYSLIKNLDASTIPQFLCYGDKDLLKGMDRYAKRLEDLKISHKTLVMKGASHGFALTNKKYAWWFREYVQWIREMTGTDYKA